MSLFNRQQRRRPMSREAGREKETRVTAIVRVSTAEIAQMLNAIICYILAMFSAHLCLLSSWFPQHEFHVDVCLTSLTRFFFSFPCRKGERSQKQ